MIIQIAVILPAKSHKCVNIIFFNVFTKLNILPSTLSFDYVILHSRLGSIRLA